MARVRLPDGRVGTIPDENVEAAVARGAEVIEEQRVRIRTPEGKIGTIPAENLAAAQGRGAELVTDEQPRGEERPRAEQAAPQTPLGQRALDALQGVAQGITLGFADEIAASAAAAFDEARDALGRGDTGTFMEKRREILELARERAEEARQRSPVSFGAGVAGGALVSPVPGARVRAGAQTVRAAAPSAGRLAATGGVAGAGFSEAEEPEELVGDIAAGALTAPFLQATGRGVAAAARRTPETAGRLAGGGALVTGDPVAAVATGLIAREAQRGLQAGGRRLAQTRPVQAAQRARQEGRISPLTSLVSTIEAQEGEAVPDVLGSTAQRLARKLIDDPDAAGPAGRELQTDDPQEFSRNLFKIQQGSAAARERFRKIIEEFE